MKLSIRFIVLLIGAGVYNFSIVAMEDVPEEALAKFLKSRSNSIVRRVYHARKTASASRATKPRKIKKCGIVAPACSPLIPESPEEKPLMVADACQLQEAGAGPLWRCKECLLCSTHRALEAHMLVSHKVFLCVCNAVCQDCQSYLEHCQLCAEEQEAGLPGSH